MRDKQLFKRIVSLLVAFLVLISICATHISASSVEVKEYSEIDIERIYGIAYLWKEAYMNYGLWEIVPELDWNLAFLDHFDNVTNCGTDFDYINELKKYLAELEDGHSYVTHGTTAFQEVMGRLPMGIGRVEEKFFIVAAGTTAGSIPYLSEIIKINNIPTDTYIRDYYFPLFGGKTKGADYYYVFDNLLSSNKEMSEIDLTLLTKEGDVINRTVTYTQNAAGTDIYSSRANMRGNISAKKHYIYDSFQVEEIEDDIFWIIIDTFANNNLAGDFEIFLKESNEKGSIAERAKGFIIDVRFNNGGSSSNGDSILKWFFDLSKVTPTEQRSQYFDKSKAAKGSQLIDKYDDFQNFEDSVAFNSSDTQGVLMLNNRYFTSGYYKGMASVPVLTQPAIILTSYRTASAAEDFVNKSKDSGRLLVLGTNTFGGTGSVIQKTGTAFNINIGFSSSHCLSYEGYSVTNNGMQPDIWCEQTIEDLYNDVDTIYTKAVELITLANADPAAYVRYIEDNRYKCDIKPFDEPENLLETAFDRLKYCGVPDGVLTDGEKFLGLAEIWRRTEQFLPMDLAGNVTDEIFKSFIGKVLCADDITQYYDALAEYLAAFGDSGSYVVYPGDAGYEYNVDLYDGQQPEFSYETFSAYLIADKLYAVRFQAFTRGMLSEEFADFIAKSGADAVIFDVRSSAVQDDISVVQLMDVLRGVRDTLANAGIDAVTLVDNGTATTSEVFAAYCKYWLKYPLIGETTAGKPGGDKAVFPLPEGGKFYLTTAVVSVMGNTVTNIGVVPDIVIKDPSGAMDAAVGYLSK